MKKTINENDHCVHHGKIEQNTVPTPEERKSMLRRLREKIASRESSLEKENRDLRETLKWVSENYRATLAGGVVRDADECLERARILTNKDVNLE